MLSRLALMVQATVLDGQFLDFFSPFDDGGVASKVGVSWCDVSDALVVAVVVVMIDEGADLGFEDRRAGNNSPAGSGSSTSDASARSCPRSAGDTVRLGRGPFSDPPAIQPDRRRYRMSRYR